jgi:hypothetical protein
MRSEPLQRSDCLAALHCSKRLYLAHNSPDLAAPLPPLLEPLRVEMNRALDLAHEWLGPGETLAGSLQERADRTRDLLRLGEPTCLRGAVLETASTPSGLRLEPDLLRCSEEGSWQVVAVRCALRVKRNILEELGLAVHALDQADVSVAGATVLHLNPDYQRGAEPLSAANLFLPVDVLAYLKDIRGRAPELIQKVERILQRDTAPHVDFGRHCTQPHPCPFLDHCSPVLHPFHIRRIPDSARLEKKLAGKVDDVRHLPSPIRISPLQRRAIRCLETGNDWAAPQLLPAMQDVEFPLGFLDFEAIQPAIPRFTGTGPFETLPTQWSLHVLQKDGTLSHKEFLHTEDSDPRPRFLDSLLGAVGETGSLVVYSNYEAGVLRRLARFNPARSEAIEEVIQRLSDLLAILRRFYYHPAFNGSYSIKRVLPALAPELDYGDLEIRDGAAAAARQFRLMDPDTPPDEREATRQALLLYCQRDTLAMVAIRRAILARCGEVQLPLLPVEE